MRNRAVADTYEPGSIFKIVAAGGALEEMVVRPDEAIPVGSGKIEVSGHIFHDSRPHDKVLSFRRVMGESSNVGVIQVASRLGERKLYEYARLFGFGTKTGIDLPGEANGILRKTKDWSGLSLSSISIGHEVTATSIQMISAFSAIANGGLLMQPFIVKAVKGPTQATAVEFRPRVIRRVISKGTAKTLTDILVGVVEEGTGVEAKVKGYKVAGKTGSSEKPSPDGKGYLPDKLIASFIGYVPAYNPKITVLVLFDEPEGARFGGDVAAPVFSRVASRTLRYLNVPPPEAAALSQKLK
jgi:cell division protein FtsI/penicillin-binding protein 2